MENNSYNTLSEATNALKKRGFNQTVKVLSKSKIKLGDKEFNSDQIEINEFHRFEGMTNPSDMSIVYAFSADEKYKGILINSYGIKASTEINDFINNIPNHE